MGHRDELVLLYFQLQLGLGKVLLGLVPMLEAQREGTPVHAYRLLAPQLQMHLHRLLWVVVRGLHDLLGLVGSDGQNGQVEGTEQISHLLEDFAVGRVPRVENLLSLGSLDHEAAPQPGVLLPELPLGPVADGHEGDLECLSIDDHLLGKSPVQFHQPTPLRKLIFRVQSCYEDGLVQFLQSGEGVTVQVVVVIVTDQHCVDRRQLVDFAGRQSVTFRPCKLHRGTPHGEDRIDDEIDLGADGQDSS